MFVNRWFKEAAEQAATQQEIEKVLLVQSSENLQVFLELGSVFEAYAPDLTVSKPIELATQTDMFDIRHTGDLMAQSRVNCFPPRGTGVCPALSERPVLETNPHSSPPVRTLLLAILYVPTIPIA